MFRTNEQSQATGGRRKSPAGLIIRSGVRAGTPSIPIPPPGPGLFGR
jgi:hypothetical protein